MKPNIQAALDYSRNFATAKPNIGRTEKEHIEGLANLLERTALENSALQRQLEQLKRFVEINANSAHGKHREALQYRAERDALQALLNAAIERVDDAVNLLEIWRTWLGPWRESCDETGKKIWDRIDAVTALKPAEGGRELYSEHFAPVSQVLPERSPKDYAIEHAEYMATSADDVLAKFQAYGLALLAVDEGGDDGEGELLENIDSARGDLQESLVELRSMIYEFRKRRARTDAAGPTAEA
ncbi:hypothetical protein SAMN04490190_0875 [Pseudomonas libanensis]|uniref:Uncharacterized protein n=1 Tax=Pseudomonas libanensis TaxID=75588 RepID=A0A0R2YGT1_9PSED|nr:hypothetical protein [Pseudomonas libanensis]KRP45387.1 hypothetical protein TU73_13365 [Pseudomonas libanensis]SDK64660.1 hypothetical protein SAMN04490190_0875 [Pseudomonas libanensis]